jgi:CheY-like chemotaxis protein
MSRQCVLIVDDNEANRTMYAVALRHYGYRVAEAWDGESAVEAAVAERPDVILMDLQMPKVNGFQATERLKARQDTAAIPVIALTGLAMAQDRAMAFAAGCDDYYAKPLEPRRLADVLAKWLNKSDVPEASR